MYRPEHPNSDCPSIPQCGNFWIFLPFRFYVKSIFADFKRSKTAILTLFATQNFAFFFFFFFIWLQWPMNLGRSCPAGVSGASFRRFSSLIGDEFTEGRVCRTFNNKSASLMSKWLGLLCRRDKNLNGSLCILGLWFGVCGSGGNEICLEALLSVEEIASAIEFSKISLTISSWAWAWAFGATHVIECELPNTVWKFNIFLPLRFCVKSNLTIKSGSKIAKLTISEAMIFQFCENLPIFRS